MGCWLLIVFDPSILLSGERRSVSQSGWIVWQAKKPDDMVSAMKGLILVRMGRTTDGLELCRGVVERGGAEGEVLRMLMHVYKSAGRVELALPAYEAMWTREPSNEEHATEVFNCHARAHSFGPQQMVAMKMYKTFEEERYLMWAVVSLLLQVRTGGDERLLNMAEMLIRRADLLKQKPVPPEVCDLLLAVLEARGNQEAVLEAIQDGGLLDGSLQPNADRLKRLAECHAALGQHDKALATYLKLIDINPDDWSYLSGYLAAYFAVHGRAGDGSAATAEEVLTFLRGLQEAQASAKVTKRGPFLAELEYECLLSKGDGAGVSPELGSARAERLIELITGYFERFGSKPCCFDDVKKYAMLLAGSGKEAGLITAMQATVSPKVAEWVAEDRTSEAAAWKFICLCRLALLLGVSSVLPLADIPVADTTALGKSLAEATETRPMSPGAEPEPEPEEVGTAAASASEARAARVAKLSGSGGDDATTGEIGGLTRLYFRSLDTLKADIADTELRVSDRVLVLIACMLYDRYLGSDGAMCFLAEGVALLREGLQRSPYNFKLKLLLFLLYLELGDFHDAWELWKSLHVRHIQNDTLLYLVLPAALRSGNYDIAGDICSRAEGFYQENERDVPDQIVNAYQHNYSNVLDFVHLQTRLRKSYGKLQSQAVSVMAELCSASAVDTSMALQIVEEGFEHVKRANAGADPLPYDADTLTGLWQNSDLTVLEFLDGGKIATHALELLDPPIVQKRASLSLACLLLHIVKHSLQDSTVESLQELLPPLLEGGGAPLAALRAAAGVEDEARATVDWGKALGELSDADAEIAIEGAVVSGLLEVLIAARGFPNTDSDALVVPAGSLRLLCTLPLHVAEAVLNEATAEIGNYTKLMPRISSMVRWAAVVPTLIFGCCSGIFPSKKAKKSRHPKGMHRLDICFQWYSIR
jgi:tetratricopeptide (TPR) repeat protein